MLPLTASRSQSGIVRDLDVAAEGEGRFELQYDHRKLRLGPEYHLNLDLVAPQARGLLPAEHVYASAQFDLTTKPGSYSVALDSSPIVVSEGDEIEVQGHDYVARIDGETGFLLSSLEYRGQGIVCRRL